MHDGAFTCVGLLCGDTTKLDASSAAATLSNKANAHIVIMHFCIFSLLTEISFVTHWFCSGLLVGPSVGLLKVAVEMLTCSQTDAA